MRTGYTFFPYAYLADWVPYAFLSADLSFLVGDMGVNAKVSKPSSSSPRMSRSIKQDLSRQAKPNHFLVLSATKHQFLKGTYITCTGCRSS